NRRVFWSQWAQMLARAGRDDEALAVLRRAAAAVPNEANVFVEQQAALYLRRAGAHVEKGNWPQALDAVAARFDKVDNAARELLRKWRLEMFLRWASKLTDAGQFADALLALDRGLGIEPDDADLRGQVCYVVQEWAKKLLADGGEEAARKMLLE